MRRAVDVAKQSVPEAGRSAPPPRVGVVVVLNGESVGESYRGETGKGRHAEFGLLERLSPVDLRGATVYTTLEPCSRRNHPKVPCAQHTIDRGVSTVFIGMYDPNPVIYREGWRLLRDAGVKLRDFSPELRAEIAADNDEFLAQFQVATGKTGEATFDFLQNGGRFLLPLHHVEFLTRWTMGGHGSIHALDYENHVAHARYAYRFDEVDDPGALDFSNYTHLIREGEIVVFRHEHGFALVRVEMVLSGPGYGDSHTEVKITYEIRLRGGS